MSASVSPGSSNTSALSAAVARSTSSRPASVSTSIAARPSPGCGSRDDEPVAGQPVDGVGDAGRMHLQAGDGAGHRHPPLACEAEQAQHLVPGERESEGPQGRVDAREQELLRPDDRRHGGHAGRGGFPAMGDPLALGFGDRVDRKTFGCCHDDLLLSPYRYAVHASDPDAANRRLCIHTAVSGRSCRCIPRDWVHCAARPRLVRSVRRSS